jgi:alkylation response protein AidB-like acyl-CoA dehydrogenase
MIVAAAHQGEDDEMSISTMLSGYSSMSNSAEMGEYRGCFNESIEDPAVARHHADIEAVYTYEGTDPIQSLIVGCAITGLNAFR